MTNSNKLTLEKALIILELTSLKGQDEKSLKRQYRLLAKDRHPDSGKESYFSLNDTKEAYDLLIDRLQNGKTEESNFIKLKPLRVYNLKNYQEEYAKNEAGLSNWFNTFDIKLDLIISIIITRYAESTKIKGDGIVINQVTKRVSVGAKMGNKYSISIYAPFEIGDELKLNLLGGFIFPIKMNTPVFSVKVPVKIEEAKYSSMEFTVSVRRIDDKEVGVSVC